MDGFDTRELSELTQDVLNLGVELFPKDVKKHMKKNGVELAKLAKKIAKGEVKVKTGNYLKGFKGGKVYYYGGDICVRGYNNSPHGHLIESGHKNVDGSYTQGKHILEKAKLQYEKVFIENTENFAEEILNKGLK